MKTTKRCTRRQSEFPGHRPGRKAEPWVGTTEAYLQAYFTKHYLVPATYRIGSREVTV